MKRDIRKVLVFVSKKAWQAHYEIPQIDVSMLMPYYPGPHAPLCGVRIFAKAMQGKDSLYKPFDLLFRADNFSQFELVEHQLQSIEWQQEELQPWILSDIYPIQIVLKFQIRVFFEAAKQYSRILLQEHHIGHYGENKAAQYKLYM